MTPKRSAESRRTFARTITEAIKAGRVKATKPDGSPVDLAALPVNRTGGSRFDRPNAGRAARQPGEMNTDEATAYALLCAMPSHVQGSGVYQPEAIILPEGSRYTPDFRFTTTKGLFRYFEVKGQFRDVKGKVHTLATGNMLKLRIAAAMNPQHEWWLVKIVRGESITIKRVRV